MDPNLENAVRSLGTVSGMVSMLAGSSPHDEELAKAAAAVSTAYGIVSERRQAEIKAAHSAALLREAAVRTAQANHQVDMLH